MGPTASAIASAISMMTATPRSSGPWQSALKPGARFVLDTGYVAETLLPVLQERAWYPIDDMIMLAQRRYEPVEGRLHVEYTFFRDGAMDRRSMSARIHTCREVCRLLEEAGFSDLQAYGSLAKEPFRLGSSRLLWSRRDRDGAVPEAPTRRLATGRPRPARPPPRAGRHGRLGRLREEAVEIALRRLSRASSSALGRPQVTSEK